MADCSNETGLESALQYSLSSFLPPAGTNQCASDAEQQSIRSAIENAHIIRHQYRNEATRLRAKLAEAEANIAQIEGYISAHQGAISAFRRLPVEVLIEIFQATFDVKVCPGAPLGYDISSFPQGPWNLSRVCHYWREIVFNCPALWSSFRIWVMPSRLENVLAALDRTGSRPLTFHLDVLHGLPVVQWLLKNSHRWENASISLRPFFQEELLGVERKLGALRRLRIISHSDNDLRSCHNVFSVASRLKEVTLVHSGHLDDVCNLPWSQISNLSIQAASISFSFLLIALREMAMSLECLELSCQSFKNPPLRERMLPAVRSLTINHVNVLKILRFPALEILVCSFDKLCDSNRFSQHISARVENKDMFLTSLHTLHMFDETSTPANLLVILRAAPRLQDLEIHVRQEASGSFLASLLPPLTDKPLLVPNLRRFSFTEGDSCNKSYQPWTELVDMVEARTTGSQGTVLHTLELMLSDGFSPATLPPLDVWALCRLRCFEKNVSLTPLS